MLNFYYHIIQDASFCCGFANGNSLSMTARRPDETESAVTLRVLSDTYSFTSTKSMPALQAITQGM